MKAMGGVNSPNNSSIPPTISITLATPRRDMSGTPALASAEGKPMNFWVPCATNRKATTMRRTPCRYRAHRSGIGALNLPPRRLGREALGRQPPGFRKLAGKRLIPDDEGQLHDLRLAKMLAHLRHALLGHLEGGAGHPIAASLKCSRTCARPSSDISRSSRVTRSLNRSAARSRSLKRGLSWKVRT